jgi:membrane protein YqaA with SNARE-associated domain
LFLELWQNPARSSQQSVTAWFRHAGAGGLFLLAILDSSPIPTFGGPDILLALLAASHRNPWYEYAGVATLGSVIGAFITFRIGRKAGMAYINKFRGGRVSGMLTLFQKWGFGALAASAAVPFPFPTSLFFAAAGASKHRTVPFLSIVVICRVIRYSLIALIAEHYGRHIIRIFRHPGQYAGWLALFALLFLALIGIGALINRKLMPGAMAPVGMESDLS